MKGSLQTKNGKYYAVFRIRGKQKWINTEIEAKCGNKRKAEAKMIEILAKYNNNPNLFNKVLFVDYARKWLSIVEHQVDPITYQGFKQNTLQHIIPYFEPLKLNLQDMKISDIEGYYNYKSQSGRLDGKTGGLSRGSIKKHSVSLNLIFKRAICEHIIKENPCEHAKIPICNNTVKKIAFYNAKQCNELLEATHGTTLYDMIFITFMYGLRRSELMGLRWCDIDFENQTVTIQHTAVVNGIVERKTKTKNASSNRIYPLLDDINDILLSIKSRQSKYKTLFGNCYVNTEYVFTREDGTPYYPDYPSKKLKKVIERNGMPHIRWHDLRHSCVCMLIEKGWHMKDIAEWVGHSDISTTMNIYGHISLEHKRGLASELNGLLKN